MSASEIGAVRQRFTPEFRERLHNGEVEALAFLLDNPDPDLRFVSGDGPALQAAAMPDPDCRVISLAEVLGIEETIEKLRELLERLERLERGSP